MKHVKKALAVWLSVLLLAVCAAPAFAADDAPGLRFRDDGTFTILHLTDSQDDQYPAKELKPFLETAIATASPDLIVFTGDLVEDLRVGDNNADDRPVLEGVVAYGITGKDTDKTNENALAAADYVLSVFEESGVPFALTQGNNDYKVNVYNAEWELFYKNYAHCVVNDMSEFSDGIDYRLPVYGSDGSLKLNLYCLDSGRAAIDAASLDWYKADSDSQKAQNGKMVPAFVFQHIPVDETANLFTPCDWSDPAGAPSGFRCYKLADTARGCFSTVYRSETGGSKEFAAWKQQGDVIAAFFGHTHQDGITGTYDGIELNITYGCEFAKSGPYGMRVITLHESDVTQYDNQSYTYTDGAFAADPDQAPAKTLPQKISMFFGSLLYLIKTMIRKVVSL